ncbi:MAG: restriction endonuclease subunit S [Leptolyngbya sp. Prado105]|jgi:type I restriction enzyme S subunit|nr:restriction endonuclease subunit S [Leptolyngbya sp. Prado105]
MSESFDVPSSWLQITLGEIINYGKAEKAEPTEIPDDAWILELEDIEKDTSKLLQRLTFAQRQSRSTKNRFRSGDVLYGKLRPYLNKVLIADLDGYCTTEILPLQPNQTIDGRFLFYWLKHPAFLSYVESVSHGLNMPRLGTESGKQAPLLLAPLNEQKRIADKLDRLLTRVDACRERCDRIPLILKRFRQSVLAAATSGELTEDWTDTREEWFTYPLGELLSDIRYGTAKKSSYEGAGDTPVIRIPNIQSGRVDTHDLKYGQFDVREIKTLALREGDVLIIRSNGSVDLVGKAAVVEPEVQGYLFAGYLIRLRPKTELINPYYLYFFLSSPSTRQYIELTARSTSGVNNINSEEVRAIKINLPPLDEQREVVKRVEKLFAFADRLEARYKTARAQVDRLTPALLEKAFQGELVPQDPNDEPASVLLERIRSELTTAKTNKTKQR